MSISHSISEDKYSQPDSSDLLRSSRWCPVIPWLEACSRSTSHYLISWDLPGHGNSGDRPMLWRWQKTDRSGDKSQRLDATAESSRHDDDDYDEYTSCQRDTKTVDDSIDKCPIPNRNVQKFETARLNKLSVRKRFLKVATVSAWTT